MPKQTEQQKADKALYTALASQLLLLALSDSGKAARYTAAADACDRVAARLRERAGQ
jgi:hypothetical protein